MIEAEGTDVFVSELALWSGSAKSPDKQANSMDEVMVRLREKIGAAMYERWFQRIVLEKGEGGHVTLKVPNLMHQYWIEDNYLPVLLTVLAEIFHLPCDVEFKVVSETAAPVLEFPVPVREAARSMDRNVLPVDTVEVAQGPLFRDDARMVRLLAESGLNSRFTFDSFVVGPNCSYSNAVAKAVAEKPGKTYNPLFLHGAVGLGKTHLMQAIGQEILRNKPKKVVRYVTSEAFTNEYIEALRHSKVSSFRQKYRKVDVLLIDDIQFFAGKGSTQEEFFHTFNDLFNSFKQIVLTSDRAPSEIKNLEDRLVSRFEWGMATQIESPDLETRTAILRQKMIDWTVQVEDWVLTFLAENIRTNVRRLEGALMRVAAHISLGNGAPLTQPVVENLLRDILEEADTKSVTIDWIQKVVAEHYDIRLADMTSHRRPASIALPRQIAMHLARELTRSSLKDIGDAFGGRDHGTVIHACKTINKRIADEEFRRSITLLIEKVKQTP
ncbi:chromosomal replication initiator protein DnaA [soil metagenome]